MKVGEQPLRLILVFLKIITIRKTEEETNKNEYEKQSLLNRIFF